MTVNCMFVRGIVKWHLPEEEYQCTGVFSTSFLLQVLKAKIKFLCKNILDEETIKCLEFFIWVKVLHHANIFKIDDSLFVLVFRDSL